MGRKGKRKGKKKKRKQNQKKNKKKNHVVVVDYNCNVKAQANFSYVFCGVIIISHTRFSNFKVLEWMLPMLYMH
jgi:hypothetical protein